MESASRSSNSFPVVTLKAGGSLVQYKPLFSYDNKYLLVPCGLAVKVFSTTSGECCLTWRGHNSTVISIQVNPANHIQVLSCSCDGIVIHWDPSDGSILKTSNLNFYNPVQAFYAPDQASSWFAVSRDGRDGITKLYSVCVQEKSVSHVFLLKPVIPLQHCIAFGTKAEFAVCIHESDLKVILLLDRTFKAHKIASWKFTCVACHPTDYIVATGDTHGRILIWANFLQWNRPSRSIYHWHTLPVADLAFSAEGSHLYSGGGECVLVKWRIGSEYRQFLPRLGLPICLVTCSGDNKYVATSHVDNAIQLISPQNQVVQVYQGLTRGHSWYQVGQSQLNPIPVGLLYDPRTQALVLNGRPGHLQFYQVQEDRQLFNVDIVGQNYATQERNQVIVNTDIYKAGLDSDGTWLATVEYRDDCETSPEIRLKFWKFNDVNQRFLLNTNVYLPHLQIVNCIRFRPIASLLADNSWSQAVTTSDEKKFKLWGLSEEADAADGTKQECWNCELIASYKQMPAKDADYSEDGSLLGVVFGHVVTLWTTNTGSLKSTLCHPLSQDDVLEIKFGLKSCCHLLVSTTPKSVTVWNLLSLTVSWRVQVHATVLARDPKSELLAVFTTDNKLFVFHPNDPNPVCVRDNVSHFPVVAAAFIPHQTVPVHHLSWQQSSQLYFMNQQQELLTICDRREEQKGSSAVPVAIERKLPQSPFAELITLRKSGMLPMEQKVHRVQGILGLREIREILDVPSHVLPPVTMLCASLLSSFLVPKSERELTDSKTAEKVSVINNNSDLESSALETEVVATSNTNQNISEYHLQFLQQEVYDWLSL